MRWRSAPSCGPVTVVREDPRAARTRGKLRRALPEECAGHALAQVSVALGRRAEIGRATFYLHYADLEEWRPSPSRA